MMTKNFVAIVKLLKRRFIKAYFASYSPTERLSIAVTIKTIKWS